MVRGAPETDAGRSGSCSSQEPRPTGGLHISMKPPGLRPRSPPPLVDRSRFSHRCEGRALRSGLLVSAVLHLLAVSLYSILLGDFQIPALTGDAAAPQAPIQGTEVVQIIELSEPEETREVPVPLEPVDDSTPQVAQTATSVVETTTGEDLGEEEDRLTVAERLQPRIVDPRLWLPLSPELLGLTDLERAQLLLRGMIQSWNDSMAVAEALSERATDWTYTDGEGRRWGLSPGRLHLGDFSIPLPLSLAPPPGRRDALADRQLIRDDIARGAATAAIRETWTERARAIRARMEEERSGPRSTSVSDDNGGGDP